MSSGILFCSFPLIFSPQLDTSSYVHYCTISLKYVFLYSIMNFDNFQHEGCTRNTEWKCMKKIQINAEKCAGCRVCEMVCSLHHEHKFTPERSRILVLKDDKYGFDYPLVCHQCDPCPSIAACPYDALNRTREGIIQVDQQECNGCGACVEACVFKAVHLDDTSIPLICDLCEGEPVCVAKCPTTALLFIEGGTVNSPQRVLKKLLTRWKIHG